MDIYHSSPITMPASTNHDEAGVNSTPPGPTTFSVGTVPNSPAPLMRPSVQQSILGQTVAPVEGRSEEGISVNDPFADPCPTPMPGTNLPLDDVQAPAIVVTAPSAAQNVRTSSSGYFALPLNRSLVSDEHVDSVASDVSGGSVEEEQASQSSRAQVYGSQSRRDSSKRQPRLGMESLATRFDSDPCILDTESQKSLENNYSKYLTAYGFLPLGSVNLEGQDRGMLERRQSTWSRHSTMYDGAGYGDIHDLYISPSNIGDFDFSPLPATNNGRSGGAHEYAQESIEEAAGHPANLAGADKENYAGAGSSIDKGHKIAMNKKENMQEIIRAYAAPLIDQEDAREGQAIEMGDSVSGASESFYEESIKESAEEDLVLSKRLTECSLGG
ncbi:hypothetical protein CC78DRAFT_545678 [Lojkania enalia]|uniref:Uncharacterized protein n=1 Tax=Lojkania enalia TaxID=147567 RepID=A0A9P4N7Q2_9PLEO|nr:hypothetical protein CC78DRAFT_545678 [Didymosphaeria enalia]